MRPSKIRFIYVNLIATEKSGVRNGWKSVLLIGGEGVRRLMANAIKNFPIFLAFP